MKKTVAFLTALILCVSLFAASSLAEGNLAAIVLSDSGAESLPSGVVMDGSVVRILKSGEYVVSGALTNGCIRVEAEQGSKVKLYLNGVSIHNETGPAIYIDKGMSRVSISLMENTENTLSDGENLIFADGDKEPNGVIFSRSDLTITGEGSLTVRAGAMDGISSKDDLRIKGGKIIVTAPRHGIRGKDSIEISNADVNVTAGKDGLRTTEDDREDRGFIDLMDSTVTLKCGDDALSYKTWLTINNTTMTCVTIQEED